MTEADTPALVAAIQRGEEVIVPDGQQVVRTGDVAFFALTSADLAPFLELLDARPDRRRKVMIAGASGLGLGPESPIVVALEQCPQPIIGAVNGAAVTGGFELALACDYLFASEHARFADTHARVGILPGWGLSQKLSRIIGINRAREMSLTGNFINAERAEAWGLVNRVCAADSLLDEALASAAQIADADPKAVAALKSLMNDGVKETLGDALIMEGERGNAFAKTVDYSQMSARLAALRQRAAKQ